MIRTAAITWALIFSWMPALAVDALPKAPPTSSQDVKVPSPTTATLTETKTAQTRKTDEDINPEASFEQQTEAVSASDEAQTSTLLTHSQAPADKQTDAVTDNETRYQQALASMQAGDYAIAYCAWKPLADANHAQAQFSLGWMYHNGYGLSINNSKALHWWRKAADQGVVNAAFALGLLLSNGDQDVKKDLSQATQYFLEAADLGHADARMMLAHLIVGNPRSMREITSQWQAAQWILVGKPLVIRVKRANVRSKPDLESTIVTVLDQGTNLVQLANHYRWLQVAIPERGIMGWVYDALVRDADNPAIASKPRAEQAAPHAEAVNPLP